MGIEPASRCWVGIALLAWTGCSGGSAERAASGTPDGSALLDVNPADDASGADSWNSALCGPPGRASICSGTCGEPAITGCWELVGLGAAFDGYAYRPMEVVAAGDHLYLRHSRDDCPVAVLRPSAGEVPVARCLDLPVGGRPAIAAAWGHLVLLAAPSHPGDTVGLLAGVPTSDGSVVLESAGTLPHPSPSAPSPYAGLATSRLGGDRGCLLHWFGHPPDTPHRVSLACFDAAPDGVAASAGWLELPEGPVATLFSRLRALGGFRYTASADAGRIVVQVAVTADDMSGTGRATWTAGWDESSGLVTSEWTELSLQDLSATPLVLAGDLLFGTSWTTGRSVPAVWSFAVDGGVAGPAPITTPPSDDFRWLGRAGSYLLGAVGGSDNADRALLLRSRLPDPTP